MSHPLATAAPLLYREMLRIAGHSTWMPRDRVMGLALLMERLFLEATKLEQLAFSTLFARISYTGHLYSIQPGTLQLIHAFRLVAKRVRSGYVATDREVQLGMRAVAETVLVLSQAAIPLEIIEQWGNFQPAEEQQRSELSFASVVRVVAVRDLPDECCLLALDEENPAETIRIRYSIPARNENFDPTIQVIRKVFGFPVTLNLLEVDIAANGEYQPRAIVVEPDYLMDVSAIAECFKETGAEPYAYLVRKFLPQENTEPILLGNIANFFLDRLLNEPDAPWQTLFRETFQLYPFAYAPMSDAEVRGVSGKSQKHFLNLKSMAMPAGGLSKQGIEAENCVLEPTFFSERYGLQGRLDLLYRNGETSAIVELKSGTPFKPNSYGIQRSHFTQTLLYDLLVRSVFGQQMDPAKYILYSGVDINPLRFAPTVAPEQWEALQLRNQLVAIERLLAKIRPGDTSVPILNKLRSTNGKGFLMRDFARFEGVYGALSFLERKYLNAFFGFVAREHWLAKVGEENSENLNGHAALWRGSLLDKQQGFCILSHLEIVENRANQPEPTILFRKTDQTNALANFRIGDIAVLYPALQEGDTVLDYQVIKCTIIELGKEFVTVQLRFRQFNLKPFDTKGLWQLEPDMMDTGFAGMCRSLLEWAAAPVEKRSLLMALQASRPSQPELPASAPVERPWEKGLTAEQAALLRKIICSEDYFLLWGPPGTGKTSVMLRALADWVLQETSDNLLLLAYTNRAVDEICAALDSLGGNIRQQYLRIGSRHVTGERYRDQLLSSNISEIKTRAELKSTLQNRRIFVSTVASFSQNDGLLKLKKFQRLVVDEASQILEPQLIGLLTRFQHFILIGDHRQLPAITVQRAEYTRVDDTDLQSISLTDLRDSYFERLYRRCEQQNWHWAYGRLSHQGRMHREIMEFANRYFYGDFLQTLPKEEPEVVPHYQHCALTYRIPAQASAFEMLTKKRVAFLPSVCGQSLPGQKTNQEEADLVARLVMFFKNLYVSNEKPWQPTKTLGIITPWRAQIAQLRVSLIAIGLDPDEITIDTVERYQGGARDIILLSTCVNSEWQLSSLVSLSTEGVDRKLNVALTRARQHVVMIGNADILNKDDRYRAFIEAYSYPA